MNEKYEVAWTTKFKKDYKQAKKRGYNLDLLKEYVTLHISFLIIYI